MEREPITVYKQIILHILHRSRLSLPQNTLLDIITGLGYTDYINAGSELGELVEAGLVEEYTTYKRTYLTLTKEGEATRLLFEEQLSPEIRSEVNEYLKNNHIETLDETVLISDYHSTTDGMYTAACAIRDGSHTLYGITLEVSNEQDAIRICDAWENGAEALYAHTLKTLMNQ